MYGMHKEDEELTQWKAVPTTTMSSLKKSEYGGGLSRGPTYNAVADSKGVLSVPLHDLMIESPSKEKLKKKASGMSLKKEPA